MWKRSDASLHQRATPRYIQIKVKWISNTYQLTAFYRLVRCRILYHVNKVISFNLRCDIVSFTCDKSLPIILFIRIK